MNRTNAKDIYVVKIFCGCFRNFETCRSRKIGLGATTDYLCFRRTSQDILVPKVPGAYYEFTNGLSREALQSIGAVCCRVTSARFWPHAESQSLACPTLYIPWTLGDSSRGARFALESIITRVLYCLTLTQLLSNNANERERERESLRKRSYFALSNINRIIRFTALFKGDALTFLPRDVIHSLSNLSRTNYDFDFPKLVNFDSYKSTPPRAIL